jgi:hypothetical protein
MVTISFEPVTLSFDAEVNLKMEAADFSKT